MARRSLVLLLLVGFAFAYSGLPYWIEHDENGNPLNHRSIWTKVNLSSTEPTKFYVYYECSVSQSDGRTVFIAFYERKNSQNIFKHASWSFYEYYTSYVDISHSGGGRYLTLYGQNCNHCEFHYYVRGRDSCDEDLDFIVDGSKKLDDNGCGSGIWHEEWATFVGSSGDWYWFSGHISFSYDGFLDYVRIQDTDNDGGGSFLKWAFIRKYDSDLSLSINYGSEETGSWEIDGQTCTKRRQITISSNKDETDYQVALDFFYFNNPNIYILARPLEYTGSEILNYSTVHFYTEDTSGEDYLVLDGQQYEPDVCGGGYCNFTLTLPEGNHTFHYLHVYSDHNETSDEYWVAIDLTPPTLSYENHETDLGNFTLTCQDEYGCTIYYCLENRTWGQNSTCSWQSSSSEVNYVIHAPGEYLVRAKAVDEAGNPSQEISFTVYSMGDDRNYFFRCYQGHVYSNQTYFLKNVVGNGSTCFELDYSGSNLVVDGHGFSLRNASVAFKGTGQYHLFLKNGKVVADVLYEVHSGTTYLSLTEVSFVGQYLMNTTNDDGAVFPQLSAVSCTMQVCYFFTSGGYVVNTLSDVAANFTCPVGVRYTANSHGSPSILVMRSSFPTISSARFLPGAKVLLSHNVVFNLLNGSKEGVVTTPSNGSFYFEPCPTATCTVNWLGSSASVDFNYVKLYYCYGSYCNPIAGGFSGEYYEPIWLDQVVAARILFSYDRLYIYHTAGAAENLMFSSLNTEDTYAYLYPGAKYHVKYEIGDREEEGYAYVRCYNGVCFLDYMPTHVSSAYGYGGFCFMLNSTTAKCSFYTNDPYNKTWVMRILAPDGAELCSNSTMVVGSGTLLCSANRTGLVQLCIGDCSISSNVVFSAPFSPTGWGGTLGLLFYVGVIVFIFYATGGHPLFSYAGALIVSALFLAVGLVTLPQVLFAVAGFTVILIVTFLIERRVVI